MSLPAFFSEVPRITVRDGLAELLGTAEGGLIEYGYEDVVRLAGHSCPTVAGAYLMARAALRALYPDAPAVRGGIEVTMRAAEDDGTTGVIAQVFTLLTGAAANNGFQGIGGRHVRRGLLRYGGGTTGAIASFRRIDNGTAVTVAMDLSGVTALPQMRALLQQALASDATPEARGIFAEAWQGRVQRLLLQHADDADVILVRSLS